MLSIRLLRAILCVLPAFWAISELRASEAKDRSRPDAVAFAGELNEYLTRLEGFGFSAQVLVMDKGSLLLNKGYGLAVREPRKPVTEQTIFDIASLTKQFTAAAILHLEMDGKLTTSDPIARHLEGVPDDKAAITIQQLITHTSGLPRDVVRNEDDEVLIRDEVVRRILRSTLRSKPGEQYAYCNAGYHLLAAIIEKRSGQAYSEYLREALFEPAGMISTISQTDYRTKGGIAARPYNEWRELSESVNRPASWHFFGPSGVSSTAKDLYRWILAVRGTKVFSPGAREKFLARLVPLEDGISYGYGWNFEKTKDGSTLISSGGDLRGSHSELRWELEHQRLIIVLTNQDVFGLPGGAVQKRIVADNLTRILDGDTYKHPPQIARMPAGALRKYEGLYVLPSRGTLKIWREAGGLRIGAEGQGAIDLLLDSTSEARNSRAGDTERASLIFDAISKGEAAGLKGTLSTSEYDTYVPVLTEEAEAHAGKPGRFRRAVVRGTIPCPYNSDLSRTYVELEFEKRTSNLFLGWDKGQLYDVTIGEGKPFPLILPIAPQSESSFATFDLFRSRTTAIRFKLDGRGIVVQVSLITSKGAVAAQKTELTKVSQQ